MLEPKLRVADLHHVPLVEAAAPVQALAVDPRAVGRVQVHDPYPIAGSFDPRVVGGRELVAVERERVVLRAADRQRYRAGLEGVSRGEGGARLDDEATAWCGRRVGAELGGREDEALLGSDLEVPRSRPDHAPDEEVEEDEEDRLEREENRLDAHQARSNRSSVWPRTILSSCSSRLRRTRLPLTSTPLVEPRSTIQKAPFSRTSSACRRETFASSWVMSHSRERPSRMWSASTVCRRPPT